MLPTALLLLHCYCCGSVAVLFCLAALMCCPRWLNVSKSLCCVMESYERTAYEPPAATECNAPLHKEQPTVPSKKVSSSSPTTYHSTTQTSTVGTEREEQHTARSVHPFSLRALDGP